MLTKIPNGRDEIEDTFGDFDDPSFEAKYLVSIDLPYPLQYGTMMVARTRCHLMAAENFRRALSGILAAGLDDEVRNYGGIYNRRPMRGRLSFPSTHSWGIAIDLEPQKYPLGSTERFPDEVVRIFREAGFFYGGDFRGRKDPMHFQLCTGY